MNSPNLQTLSGEILVIYNKLQISEKLNFVRKLLDNSEGLAI